MIEINKTDSKKSIKEKLKALKKSKSSTTHTDPSVNINQSPFFDKLLEVTQIQNVKLELDKLMEEIDKAGKRFVSDTNLENLKQYKALIKSFLDTLLNKMFKIKNITNWKKNKVYVLIEKINDKMEKLTRYILEKENENINLLATLDEIRGLLVDLYK